MSGQTATTLLDRNAFKVRAADRLEVIHPDVITTCPDCRGTGIAEDDGSITGLEGWPIPCCCVVNNPHGLEAFPAASTLHLPAATVPVRRRAVTW